FGARALRRRRAFLRADRARFRDRQDRGVGARGIPEQGRCELKGLRRSLYFPVNDRRKQGAAPSPLPPRMQDVGGPRASSTRWSCSIQIVNNNLETMERGRRLFPTAGGCPSRRLPEL